MLYYLFLILLAFLCFFILKTGGWVHDLWVKRYPPVDYLQSSEKTIESWRWWKPDRRVGIPYDVDGYFGVKNKPGVSSLIFSKKFRFKDVSALLLGGFVILPTLLQIGTSLKSGTITETNFFSVLIIYLFLFSLGSFFLRIGERVLQIDLYPDRLEIITTYAFFFRGKTIYTRDSLLEVKGKPQRFWAMESGQIEPDYIITIRQLVLGFFQTNQTFSLICNQTQGSWVVGGLNHWKLLSARH